MAKGVKKRLPHRVAIAYAKGYSKGYKKGYMDHSDETYTRAMFIDWKEHVAESSEKHATFNNHSRIKIVEFDKNKVKIENLNE